MRVSEVSVVTVNGSRYLRNLLQHWSHRFPVELNEAKTAGQVELPQAKATFRAEPEALQATLLLAETADQDRVETVVAEHLQRFGYQETLQFPWVRSERD